MSVIINELEVVTVPKPPPSAPPNSPAPRPPAPGPTPFEMRAIIRHLAHRADRVRADQDEPAHPRSVHRPARPGT